MKKYLEFIKENINNIGIAFREDNFIIYKISKIEELKELYKEKNIEFNLNESQYNIYLENNLIYVLFIKQNDNFRLKNDKFKEICEILQNTVYFQYTNFINVCIFRTYKDKLYLLQYVYSYRNTDVFEEVDMNRSSIDYNYIDLINKEPFGNKWYIELFFKDKNNFLIDIISALKENGLEVYGEISSNNIKLFDDLKQVLKKYIQK